MTKNPMTRPRRELRDLKPTTANPFNAQPAAEVHFQSNSRTIYPRLSARRAENRVGVRVTRTPPTPPDVRVRIRRFIRPAANGASFDQIRAGRVAASVH
jgi:hypothetical protein